MKNRRPIKLQYTKQNIFRGALIYSIGDTIASLLLNEFSVYRLLGMVLIGATVYAFEIPNYFNWIEKKTANNSGLRRTIAKTILAIAYFNPFWIFIHCCLLVVFSEHPYFIYR